ADHEYAQVFLVDTAPQAIQHLQQAIRLDPFHSRGLDSLMMLLFITGRKDEFREAVTQLRLSSPESTNQLCGDIFLRAIDGDRSGVDRAVARLGETGYTQLVPIMRSFADVIVLAQSDDFF